MIEKKTGKLTTRMFVLMAVSAVAALGCMFFLYESRFLAYQILMERGVVKDGRDEYISWIFQEAPKYDLEPTGHVPEEEREMVDREYLPFLFEHRDPYIGFSIYREDTGKYVTSYLPEILDNEYFSTWIWQDSNMLAAQDERVETYIQFKDCTACMLVENYRIMKIMPLYMGGCLLFCVALFLIPVLVFVHRRMAYLGKVRAQMLVMAEGDLEHPITAEGKDEMAALAGELDYLRQALRENIEKERQSHLANQELIRAMSHDLRTP